MKNTNIFVILLLFISMSFSEISYSQNIKFYKDNSFVAVNTIDFDKDSILYIAIKADTSLQKFDMLMFSTTISHKNGKRKWGKVNDLMPETFFSKLQDDGYYHFVAYRNLGNGLSYSEIGLTFEDFRYGEIKMNTSLYGKIKLNNNQNTTTNTTNVINTNYNVIQYEADVVDFSLPVTVKRFNKSANIRTKRIFGSTFGIIGLTALIVSPTLILLKVLQ
ncbi:MAG: hypothetical protein JXL97_12285 [Bacteroidales bacterium]|nr:hypothetical protein [Bacteroidales bacterium]